MAHDLAKRETAQSIAQAAACVREQRNWIVSTWGGLWIAKHDPKHVKAVNDLKRMAAELAVRREAFNLGM